MTYESYPNKAAVKSRLTRKQQRRNISVKNKKMKKLQRKTERLQRAELLSD